MMMQNRLNDKAKDIEGLKKQTSFLLNSAWQKGYVAGFDDGYKTSRQAEESQRPQGEWMYDNILNNWKCSECGETPKTIGYVGTRLFMEQQFKFCNHCGACMRVKNELNRVNDELGGRE